MKIRSFIPPPPNDPAATRMASAKPKAEPLSDLSSLGVRGIFAFFPILEFFPQVKVSDMKSDRKIFHLRAAGLHLDGRRSKE